MGIKHIMDKWQGLQSFWSSFGIPAYDKNAVPDDAVMPYITYQASVASFEYPIPLNADLWYHATNWRDISQKAEEIAERIRTLYLVRLEDNQYIMLAQGSPFAQRMGDEDGDVKRIYLNVMAEYLTRR